MSLLLGSNENWMSGDGDGDGDGSGYGYGDGSGDQSLMKEFGL